MPLSPLESRLRYEFRNAELLRQALTHRSHSASHNERLEFLGDSVLNCGVAALLFQRFSKLDEGDLSRVRANLVKQQSLYEIAQALNISESLRLGEGELRSGGFRRPSILADTLEAILGAIFLDGGFDAAQTVIKRLYVPILDHIDPRTLGKDAKTLLQEYLQGHKIALPSYTVVATHGAAHNQQFEVECTVPKLEVKVSGSGASRRAAEQAAARKALDEVMALAPALGAKPKRSRSARGARNAELEVVPGVTGVQGALDLRAPDRKLERAARAESGKAAAGEAAAERAGAVPPVTASAAPLAVIRAAHVEYTGQASGSGQQGGPAAQDKSERADKDRGDDKAASEKPKADRADSSRATEPKTADRSEAPRIVEAPRGADRAVADKPAAARNRDAQPDARSDGRADGRADSRAESRADSRTDGRPDTRPDAAAATETGDAGFEAGVAGSAVRMRAADTGH
jgi:ribonuclease III